MFSAQQIKQDMVVTDIDGRHVGTVSQIEDDIIGLKREGFADDLHHFVPLAAVMKIDDNHIIVEPGHVTTVEAVAGALRYARRSTTAASTGSAIFGISTASGGSGINY